MTVQDNQFIRYVTGSFVFLVVLSSGVSAHGISLPQDDSVDDYITLSSQDGFGVVKVEVRESDAAPLYGRTSPNEKGTTTLWRNEEINLRITFRGENATFVPCISIKNRSKNKLLMEKCGEKIHVSGNSEFLFKFDSSTDGRGWMDLQVKATKIDGTLDPTNNEATPVVGREIIRLISKEGDFDNDGLKNEEEAGSATHMRRADTDGDGLSDGREIELGTNPIKRDTDGDQISDGIEVNELSSDPTVVDSDNDGLNDGIEVRNWNTDPTKKDSDGDGLSDEVEVNSLETSPIKHDSDGDGLIDSEDPKPTIPQNNEASDPTDSASPINWLTQFINKNILIIAIVIAASLSVAGVIYVIFKKTEQIEMSLKKRSGNQD